MSKNSTQNCSMCGRFATDVEYLFTGHRANICSNCIEMASQSLRTLRSGISHTPPATAEQTSTISAPNTRDDADDRNQGEMIRTIFLEVAPGSTRLRMLSHASREKSFLEIVVTQHGVGSIVTPIFEAELKVLAHDTRLGEFLLGKITAVVIVSDEERLFRIERLPTDTEALGQWFIVLARRGPEANTKAMSVSVEAKCEQKVVEQLISLMKEET